MIIWRQYDNNHTIYGDNSKKLYGNMRQSHLGWRLHQR